MDDAIYVTKRSDLKKLMMECLDEHSRKQAQEQTKSDKLINKTETMRRCKIGYPKLEKFIQEGVLVASADGSKILEWSIEEYTRKDLNNK